MDRTRFYSAVIPAAGIIYVIVLFLTDFNTTVVIVGALVLALIAVVGSSLFRPPSGGRTRHRNRP